MTQLISTGKNLSNANGKNKTPRNEGFIFWNQVFRQVFRLNCVNNFTEFNFLQDFLFLFFSL